MGAGGLLHVYTLAIRMTKMKLQLKLTSILLVMILPSLLCAKSFLPQGKSSAQDTPPIQSNPTTLNTPPIQLSSPTAQNTQVNKSPERPQAPATGYTTFLPLIQSRFPFQNIFGVTVSVYDQNTLLDQLSSASTGWSRLVLSWGGVESSVGARNWDPGFEAKLLNLAAHQAQPVVILEETPSWAWTPWVPTNTCGPVTDPARLTALGQFAYDMVKRYSAYPYNVHTWELWNEPDAQNAFGCWGNYADINDGGQAYGQMLKVVYPQIKAADPQAQVLVGGLLLECDPRNPPPAGCAMGNFLKGILAANAGSYFDGVSFHSFDFLIADPSSPTPTAVLRGRYDNSDWHSAWNTTGPVSILKSGFLKSVLASYNVTGKYLMNTETAVFYGPNVQNILCTSYLQGMEQTKAFYVTQSYATALAEGWKANIWYSDLGVRCSGVFKTDYTPQPVFFAYQLARQQLGSAAFVQKVTAFGGVMGYEFLSGGSHLWVLWSADGNSHTVTVPGVVVAVTRVGDDGNPAAEAAVKNVTIDLSPRYIQFNP